MSIVTGKKQKFSVRDFVSQEWNTIRSKLHGLGFAIFENAKTNEVTLIHDVELASANAVEGNYSGVESDALQAARVLLESHAPIDAQNAKVVEEAKTTQENAANDSAQTEPVKTNNNMQADAPVNVESGQQQIAKMQGVNLETGKVEPQKPGTLNDPKQIPDAPAAQEKSPPVNSEAAQNPAASAAQEHIL